MFQVLSAAIAAVAFAALLVSIPDGAPARVRSTGDAAG
jgi:hypothetical protein